MKSTTRCRLGFGILALIAGLVLSELITGAPASLAAYYLYDYNGSTNGKIIESWTRGRLYHVEYEYEVKGLRYTSTQVNHSANYRSVAYETVRKYPVGKEVTVFFDDFNPKHAVLEKKTPGAWIWGQILSAVILFGALVPVYCPGEWKRVA